MNAHQALKWLLGVTVLAALLIWVQLSVGWSVLLAPWRNIAPATIASALILALLSYALRAVRIYDYFHADLKGRFAAVLRLTLFHNFANNLLPMRLGEAVFPLLMRRYFGQALAKSAVSLLWVRVLDLHVVLLVAAIVIATRSSHALALLLPLAWLLALPLALLIRAPLLALTTPARGKIAAIGHSLLLHAPADVGLLTRLYGWTLLSWGSKLSAFTLIVQHFVDIGTWRTLLGVIGAELSSVLPVHGIGGSGSYEAAMVLTLMPLGVEHEVALIAAVNLHLFLLGCTLLLALLGYLLPKPARSTQEVVIRREDPAK